ncbi:hypothetical protein CPB84DRAFT_1841411 [Gymnopilus junonius]|uniref:Uncharacterized protein n=1 Tax=Gymnopilus junonius TaxID=109634 RepID=A0A9P5P296_GYMJU|nr:hypothetical protein CPB84DRAFT_1841411 [Gymnopilus junonius]
MNSVDPAVQTSSSSIHKKFDIQANEVNGKCPDHDPYLIDRFEPNDADDPKISGLLVLNVLFVYGCLYLLFAAYPIVFTEAHNFNAGISGLMFIPIPLGGAFAVLLYVLYFNPKYEDKSAKIALKPVPPEFRLEIAFYA